MPFLFFFAVASCMKMAPPELEHALPGEHHPLMLVSLLATPKVLLVLDICSDVNLGVRLAAETYVYNGMLKMRHGWWVAVNLCSVLVPFICITLCFCIAFPLNRDLSHVPAYLLS